MNRFDRVYILNDMPYPTAIFKLAVDLYDATGGRANLIHLGKQSSEWDDTKTGEVLVGKTLPVMGNSLSYFFPIRSYSGLKGVLRSLKQNGGRILYANQSVYPIRKSSSDVIHINDNPYSVIETDLYSLSRARKRLTRRHYDAYKKFENVIVNTNYVRKSLENYGFSGKMSVISPLVREEFRHLDGKSALRAELALPQEKKLVLSVTNGVRRKNLKYVEEVVEKLGDQFRLVRVGEKIGNSITFNGISEVFLNKLYNACDVLLFPSLEEGFGLPVVEAFAAGTPAVVSDIEVMHEVAGEAALYSDPYSTDEGTRIIRDALSVSEELTKKGFDRAKLFTPEKFRQNISEFLVKL